MPTRHKLLMVYPQQGFSGIFVKHTPLSLLYASANLVQAGVEVKIIDNRLHTHDWTKKILLELDDETLAVGLSVMSGSPIKNAIEVSRLVKSKDPSVAVIWGGPHATFNPESIFEETSVDYVIKGYANESLFALYQRLKRQKAVVNIPGVGYRTSPTNFHIEPEKKVFEKIPYQHIPYQLIDDYRAYGQVDQNDIIFSMYSVLGCPYKCSFCSSPAQYKGIPGKPWQRLEVEEVVDHIEYVRNEYEANFIYFIDDDSFPSLKHVEGIIDEIERRNIDIKLGFRGARINEIKRMSHAYLEKLAAAGTNIMHIGAESGSNRILKLIRKDCTVDEILDCNRKLAKHPEITIGYNFMMGLPTETLQDVRKTRDLMLKLIDENPKVIIFQPNRFRPLPGTELYDLAIRHWDYTPPRTLEEWQNIECEGDYEFPWYPKGMKRFCDLMLISSYFVDNKIYKVTKGQRFFYKFMRIVSRLYAPIVRLRLKKGWDRFLIEYSIYKKATKLLVKLRSLQQLKPNPSPSI